MPKNDPPEAFDPLIETVARMLDLPLGEADRGEVCRHLAVSANLASKVSRAPLPDPTIENAPVFSAVPRPGDTT